jgi:hypothetical protein
MEILIFTNIYSVKRKKLQSECPTIIKNYIEAKGVMLLLKISEKLHSINIVNNLKKVMTINGRLKK